MIRRPKVSFPPQPDFADPERSTGKQAGLMTRIYALLDDHLHDPAVCVNWLADQLVMNRKTLYRRVFSLSQLTPTALIRRYRLHKAADLLRTGYTVTQTADSTGFKTPSHFTTVFKGFYRQTPTEFMARGVVKS